LAASLIAGLPELSVPLAGGPKRPDPTCTVVFFGNVPVLLVVCSTGGLQLTGSNPKSTVVVPTTSVVSIVGCGVAELHSKNAPAAVGWNPDPVTVTVWVAGFV
jgi:hypothetical protein